MWDKKKITSKKPRIIFLLTTKNYNKFIKSYQILINPHRKHNLTWKIYVKIYACKVHIFCFVVKPVKSHCVTHINCNHNSSNKFGKVIMK
jgi:hypothetical protein